MLENAPATLSDLLGQPKADLFSYLFIYLPSQHLTALSRLVSNLQLQPLKYQGLQAHATVSCSELTLWKVLPA